MGKPLGANRERGVWGASEASPPPDFLEEPAAQFPPNHLLAPSGLRITAMVSGAQLFQVSDETFRNWRWQMAHQLRTREDFPEAFSLAPEEIQGLEQLGGVFRTGVTPYYASLMDFTKPSCPLRLQAIPRIEEKEDPLGVADPLDERLHSPVREVVHLYPDRVAFCVAMLCPVYCRYCYRKRRDEEEGLHFNRKIVERGLEYIRQTPSIRDVLITGGDPFIASDESLESLLAQLRSIPHVEIIRFGTRTPVTLPFRITKELSQMLAKYHPVWLNTHFNCEEELTPDAAQALTYLVDAGIPVGNQAVLLRGVNDDAGRMKTLCQKLIRLRVRPYYVFHPHLVKGTAHLRTSVKEGLAIMKSLRGQISGFAIPTYIVDTPSGKVPVAHNHILGTDGDDLLLEDLKGDVWREKGAWT
ncbi:MAG: KamA family radical SAM protein [Deltaproteobacteria bacterium]|nr:KamA family radical SAM protein [Deltaproteobacteria bacterium]